jgi:hypothetical protein
VTRCPALAWRPTLFADRRYFAGPVAVTSEDTPAACDCLHVAEETAKSLKTF